MYEQIEGENPYEDRVTDLYFRPIDDQFPDRGLVIDHREVEAFGANVRTVAVIEENIDIADEVEGEEQQLERMGGIIDVERELGVVFQAIKRDSHQLRQTSVIGWMSDNGLPIFIHKRHTGLDYYSRPHKLEIFPVMVFGCSEGGVDPHIAHQFLPQLYDYGNYLLFADIDDNKDIPQRRVTIIPFIVIMKENLAFRQFWDEESNQMKSERVGNYKGMYLRYGKKLRAIERGLKLHCYHPPEYIDRYGNTPDTIQTMPFISRIYDINDTRFAYRGIYGGGTQPQDTNRATVDQPIDANLDHMMGNFRFDTSYQKYMKRVGYFCSKYAFMVCSDHRTELLLKSHTFAIIDGLNQYCFYSEARKTLIKIQIKFEIKEMSLLPKVVIVTEGISSLTITMSEDGNNWRKAEFSSSNLRDESPPLKLDWYSFQSDLEVSSGDGQYGITQPLGLTQIMHFNDINDCIAATFENNRYLFSLASIPGYSHGPGVLHDRWNLFCLLDDHYYFHVCVIVHHCVYRRHTQIKKFRKPNTEMCFSRQISAQLYPRFATNHYQQIVDRAVEFIERCDQSQQYINFAFQLLDPTIIDQFRNTGFLSYHRIEKINELRN